MTAISKTTYTATVISHEAALRMIAVAMEEGSTRGMRVTVAVVDPSFTLMAFARTNGTPADAESVTRRKANTAVAMGRPTGNMRPEVEVALPMASGNQLTSLGGGYPIRIDGQLVGGIGIGGGSTDQDAEVAAAAVAAIGGDPA